MINVKILFLFVLAAGLGACSSDNDNPVQPAGNSELILGKWKPTQIAVGPTPGSQTGNSMYYPFVYACPQNPNYKEFENNSPYKSVNHGDNCEVADMFESEWLLNDDTMIFSLNEGTAPY